MSILDDVRKAAALRILFLAHAARQMMRPERMITPRDVEEVVRTGEVIEDYADDVRGHSGLLLGSAGGRAIHVVCAPKDGYLAIITAYVPDEHQWSVDLRTRK